MLFVTGLASMFGAYAQWSSFGVDPYESPRSYWTGLGLTVLLWAGWFLLLWVIVTGRVLAFGGIPR